MIFNIFQTVEVFCVTILVFWMSQHVPVNVFLSTVELHVNRVSCFFSFCVFLLFKNGIQSIKCFTQNVLLSTLTTTKCQLHFYIIKYNKNNSYLF